jgi:hypothetical protein
MGGFSFYRNLSLAAQADLFLVTAELFNRQVTEYIKGKILHTYFSIRKNVGAFYAFADSGLAVNRKEFTLPAMYSKLFSRITESSLMEEPIPTRYVFVMLLAIADAQGYVIGTDVAIARRINMPLRDFLPCIDRLMEPDAHSNSQAEDGRRVIRSDGERGYKIVNYTVYREINSANGKREYMRDYMRDYRAGKTRKIVNSNPASAYASTSSTSRAKHFRQKSPAQREHERRVLEDDCNACGHCAECRAREAAAA